MRRVPESGAMPDIVAAEIIHHEYHAGYLLIAFQDVSPLAVRRGGGALITFPFVLTIMDQELRAPVYFITAEQGAWGTSCLCAFDGEGRHYNMGPWSPEPAASFIERATEIARGVIAADGRGSDRA